MANLLGRRLMGGSLERVVFSPPGAELPVSLNDYRSRQVALTPQNLQAALLASCSIPFWLQAVHDIPGAPRGAYWDGGITDYHLHLNYAAMLGSGLVLYPHFQRQVIPGWLDKGFGPRWPAHSLGHVKSNLAGKLEFAMKLTRITLNSAQMGGVPCIRGLRIPVAAVVGMVAEGLPDKKILEAYPDLEPEDIREALRYAAQAVRERELPLATP